MNGAREYATMFSTCQHGRLYLVSGSHARGKTFHIYVLPDGIDAISNGPNNGPLNKDKVEVYGIISGQPGWTESYGWLHTGKWQEDFAALVAKRREEIAAYETRRALEKRDAEEAERKRTAALLSQY